MRVILMGMPGAGKGTQAASLAARLAVPHVSTGDMFRSMIAAGTPLGREAQGYLDAGAYVPDELTTRMLAERLAHSDAAAGWILDGYPRTLTQVGDLDGILAGAGAGLDRVIHLQVPAAEVRARLQARATAGRSDDLAEVVDARLRVYREQTQPLLDCYAARDQLVDVDGTGEIAEVTERIAAALGLSGAIPVQAAGRD